MKPTEQFDRESVKESLAEYPTSAIEDIVREIEERGDLEFVMTTGRGEIQVMRNFAALSPQHAPAEVIAMCEEVLEEQRQRQSGTGADRD